MKCENCRFLRTEGYEYPESYCGAGVAEDDERATSAGDFALSDGDSRTTKA